MQIDENRARKDDFRPFPPCETAYFQCVMLPGLFPFLKKRGDRGLAPGGFGRQPNRGAGWRRIPLSPVMSPP